MHPLRGLARVEHLGDAATADPAHEIELPTEARDGLRLPAEVPLEDLHRRVAPVDEALGAVDLAHTASTEHLAERVAADRSADEATRLRVLDRARDVAARGAEGEVGLHASLEDGGAERLVNVVDRAHLEPERLLVDRRARGQEDDRDLRGARVTLQATADFVTVHPGHADVEQDEVRLLRPVEHRERLLSPLVATLTRWLSRRTDEII